MTIGNSFQSLNILFQDQNASMVYDSKNIVVIYKVCFS